jgi:hypothetical protein
MKLKREEKTKVSVEINNIPFINGDNGILFQNTDSDNEFFIYIKDSSTDKEIKIKIWKDDSINV